MMLEPASIGMISGAALFSAVGVQLVREARTLLRRRSAANVRTERRRREFVGRLDQAMQLAKASHPSLKAWRGARPFCVTAVIDEAHGCRSYYLVPEDGRPLPRFQPGQYLTFHLPIDDLDKPLVRCYSLSDRPRDDYYRVTVKRVGPPAALPDCPAGKGSTYFHRHVQPGSKLDVEAPQGEFFLDPTDNRPVVLIGAGIGVTPVTSMALALSHAGDARQAYLFAGFRNGCEYPFRRTFNELRRTANSLAVNVSFSQPTRDEVEGRDFDHRGYVDVDHLRHALPANNFIFYLCGPPAMMQSLVPALLDWGVPREHIRYEAFGPATIRSLSDAATTEPCDVQFARSGQSARWDGAQSSLLDLAERAGIAINSGCRAGSCGQCRLRVSAGKVVHAKRPGVELVDGECLACIATPQTDVVLDA